MGHPDAESVGAKMAPEIEGFGCWACMAKIELLEGFRLGVNACLLMT